MDWRKHTPIVSERVGISDLSIVAGVTITQINSWASRGGIMFRGVGRGTTRSYTLWQAIHLAIISELASMRVSVTGPGADLSEAMLAYVRHRITENASTDGLGCLVLVPERGALDWSLHPLEHVGKVGSCLVFDLSNLVAGVAARWDELSQQKPLGRIAKREQPKSPLHSYCRGTEPVRSC